jgi:hypothetical protein
MALYLNEQANTRPEHLAGQSDFLESNCFAPLSGSAERSFENLLQAQPVYSLHRLIPQAAAAEVECHKSVILPCSKQG